jgi:pilus assembly protein CpaB
MILGDGDTMFRYRYLVMAIILALVGTRLTQSYIQKLEQQATGEGPRAPVVIARSAIPKGTEMQTKLVESRMWPISMVPQGAITDTAEVEGRFTSVDLVPGEVVLANRLIVQDERNLSWQLSPGERAIAVSVSGVTGLEAEIASGSRVDILGTILDYQTGIEHSLMVLEDIPVLGVADTEDVYGSALGSQKVVLAVSPEQAKRIALFDSSGSLQILLRPEGAGKSSGENGPTLTTRDILGQMEEKGIPRWEALSLSRDEETEKASERSSHEPLEREVEIIRGTTTSLEIL